jgi:hypothetical protein
LERSRAVRTATGLAVAVALAVFGAAPAAAEPPPLTGEVLYRHVAYTGPTADVCTTDPMSGATSYSFAFEGTAAGPYSGSFTADVAVTIGPPTAGVLALGPFPDGFDLGSAEPPDFLPAGQLLTLDVTFEISSAAGDVVGSIAESEVVDADQTRAGVCKELVDAPRPGGGTVTGAYKDVRFFDGFYEAEITTPEEVLLDEGTIDLQGRQGEGDGGAVFDVDDFAARFVSGFEPDPSPAPGPVPVPTPGPSPGRPPGPGPGPATPADTSPPTVPGKAASKLTKRTLALRIGPFAEAVSGTVAVTSRPLKTNAAAARAATPKRLRIKLGPTPFQVSAGQSASVKFRLSKEALRAVKRKGKVKLKVVVRALDAADNASTRTLKVTLKAKKGA